MYVFVYQLTFNQSINQSYRQVSLLPKISRLFERCMHRQIPEYFETIFSKFQCGFRKGYGTQNCISHGSKLQKSIGLRKGIWCFAN